MNDEAMKSMFGIVLYGRILTQAATTGQTPWDVVRNACWACLPESELVLDLDWEEEENAMQKMQ